MIKLRLFGKVASVIVISLSVTSVMTMIISKNVMEKIFIDSYTESNAQILNQININLNKLNQQNISITELLRKNIPLKEYLTNSIGEDEQDLFSIYYKIEQNILDIGGDDRFSGCSISVKGENNRIYNIVGDSLIIEGDSLAKYNIDEELKKNPFKIKYVYNNGLELYGKNEHNIMVIKSLMVPYSDKIFGTMYMKIDEKIFREIYEDFIGKDEQIMIMDTKGTIVSSNNEKIIGSKNEVILSEVEDIHKNNLVYKIVKEGGDKKVILGKYLSIYDMYIVNEVGMNNVLQAIHTMIPLFFSMCFIITILTMICVFIITRKITLPITKLIEQMQCSQNGCFVKTNQIKGSYEVRELQYVYNTMIDELNSYIDSMIMAQKQKRKAELEALQMQINPHFLYNTLATIKYLGWKGDTKTLTETINSLIDLLQNTIGKTDEMITIKDEIVNLRNYVTINKARYGEDIKVDFYIEESCEKELIPKLILQPFVENSFFHGYQNKQDGHIRVFIQEEKGYILCEIADDGDGIKEKPKNNKQNFSGIGIKNVDERIKLIYGEKYGVSITSNYKKGTIVSIKLPKS